MADFEDDLRNALRAVVPPDLEAPGLAEGARRHARRARRVRVVGVTAALALVLAIVGTSGYWFGGRRDTAPPARPQSTYTGPTFTGLTSLQCGQKASVTAPPARPAAVLGDAMARLCPTGSGADAATGSGWVLPTEPLTTERWIGYLRGAIAAEDTTRPCAVAASDLGAEFTVLVQRLDGRRVAYRSQDLRCRGRDAVARYLAALARQRADIEAAATTGYTITCAVPDAQDANLDGPPLAGAGLRRPEAVLCLYPNYPLGVTGQLVTRPYRRIVLTPSQVRVLDTDLATSTLRKRPAEQCDGARWALVLRMVRPGSHSPDGEMAEFSGSCPEQLRLKDYRVSWRPGGEALGLLGSLLPPR